MKGTEKQVAWAEQIIRDAQESIDNNIARWENENAKCVNGGRPFELEVAILRVQGENLKAKLADPKMQDAAYVIEHRDMFDTRKMAKKREEVQMYYEKYPEKAAADLAAYLGK